MAKKIYTDFYDQEIKTCKEYKKIRLLHWVAKCEENITENNRRKTEYERKLSQNNSEENPTKMPDICLVDFCKILCMGYVNLLKKGMVEEVVTEVVDITGVSLELSEDWEYETNKKIYLVKYPMI